LGTISRFFKALTDRGGLARDSFNIFAADSMVMVLGMAASILLARLFGPEGKGVITMVLLIPLTLHFIGLFGMAETTAFFISRFKDQVRENFYSIQALSWFFGIIVVAGAYFSFNLWYPAYQSYPKLLFLISIPAALFLILMTTLKFSMLGLQDMLGFNLYNIGQAGVNLLIVLIAGFLLNRSLRDYCVLNLAGVSALAVLGFIALARKPEIGGFPGKLHFEPVLTYAVRNYPSNLVIYIQSRVDHFIIGYFLAPSQLGIYSIAILLSENLLRVTSAFQMALFPRVSADLTEKKYLLAARVLRVTGVFNVLLSLAVAAVGYPLIQILFGKAFLPAYIPLVILLASRVPEGFCKIATATIAGIGRPGLVSVFSFVGVSCNCLLGIILIPRIGLVGASLAQTAAAVIQMAPTFVYLVMKSGLRPSQFLLPDREDYNLAKTIIAKWLPKTWSEKIK
jgi:O-antigen/teichoic acid export membrane protein